MQIRSSLKYSSAKAAKRIEHRDSTPKAVARFPIKTRSRSGSRVSTRTKSNSCNLKSSFAVQDDAEAARLATAFAPLPRSKFTTTLNSDAHLELSLNRHSTRISRSFDCIISRGEVISAAEKYAAQPPHLATAPVADIQPVLSAVAIESGPENGQIASTRAIFNNNDSNIFGIFSNNQKVTCKLIKSQARSVLAEMPQKLQINH